MRHLASMSLLLTHWSLSKVVTFGQNNIFKCILLNKICCSFVWIQVKFVPEGPVDNESSFV